MKKRFTIELVLVTLDLNKKMRIKTDVLCCRLKTLELVQRLNLIPG